MSHTTCHSLQHAATHCTHCNTLHHTAPHCTTLHHTASHCNTHCNIHCTTADMLLLELIYSRYTLQRTLLHTHCNTHCNTLCNTADMALPELIYSHGFLTKDGLKMGKSLGNVLEPDVLLQQHGRLLQCVAMCCSELQCVAACCSVWQMCCSVLQ